MTEIERQILINQIAILAALKVLLRSIDQRGTERCDEAITITADLLRGKTT